MLFWYIFFLVLHTFLTLFLPWLQFRLCNAGLTNAVPFSSGLLYTLAISPPPEKTHCCSIVRNTKLLISLLPSSSVKRGRDEHEAQGSGTQPQKKRQKEERKTEDGSSPSSHIHRLKTTHTHILNIYLANKTSPSILIYTTETSTKASELCGPGFYSLCWKELSLQHSHWLQLLCPLGSLGEIQALVSCHLLWVV